MVSARYTIPMPGVTPTIQVDLGEGELLRYTQGPTTAFIAEGSLEHIELQERGVEIEPYRPLVIPATTFDDINVCISALEAIRFQTQVANGSFDAVSEVADRLASHRGGFAPRLALAIRAVLPPT